MGVTSAGRRQGSAFFFQLPVYGSDYSPQLPHTPQQQLSQPKPANLKGRKTLHPSSVACDDGDDHRRHAWATEHSDVGPRTEMIDQSDRSGELAHLARYIVSMNLVG